MHEGSPVIQRLMATGKRAQSKARGDFNSLLWARLATEQLVFWKMEVK
jgi:hypothetical protein